jgi:hypothetical protein
MPSTVPFRVVLTKNGVSRKFFTLFQGKDGSLYIHPNRENLKPWQTPSLANDETGMKIDFNNSNIPGFELHKISFHPSGYIHLTNKNGERYREGTRGPTFEEMDSLYLLCIIAPCKLEEMPLFENDPKCMLIDLVVPDNISPFFMTLALAKEEVGPPEDDGSLITPRFILPLNSGYKLTFLLRAVKPKDNETLVNWPPFPFFLLRTAA